MSDSYYLRPETLDDDDPTTLKGYDDFTASDVLAAFIRDRMCRATLSRFRSDALPEDRFLHTQNAIHGDRRDRYYLTLDGGIEITPEQAAVLSPLFTVSRGGSREET